MPFFRTMGKELGALEGTGKFLGEYYHDDSLFKAPKPDFLENGTDINERHHLESMRNKMPG